MGIQFLCQSCDQPIEIDDEWASQQVACPFCRKTVTAPAESTFSSQHQIPTAAPFVPPAPVGAIVEGSERVDDRSVESRNRVAIAALVISLTALISIVVFNVAVANALADRLVPGMTPEEMQAALLELPNAGELLISGFVVGLFWLAGLICGIVAATRPGKRGPAVASLVISAVPVVFSCAGFLLGS